MGHAFDLIHFNQTYKQGPTTGYAGELDASKDPGKGCQELMA